jgi:hypoxanthine phosphoribosyltransferase
MSQTSYDYSTRSGILPISWADFHGLCNALALAVEPYAPEIILPVARGGYYAGALLAHILCAEVYAIRLTRRVNDIVTRVEPLWLQEPPAAVAGRRVLIVDEISSTGETLRLARAKALEMGAAQVRTAVLYAHTWGMGEPDYIALISDALLMNPWDREILREGSFEFNPEYAGALAEQGLAADPSLLIPATPFKIAKRHDGV